MPNVKNPLKLLSEKLKAEIQPAAVSPPPVLRSPLIEHTENTLASVFHHRLVKSIERFDAELDGAHEVGVRLVSFGQTVVFHLEALGYSDPALISFKGRMEDGSPVELIQHVSQISILLMKLPLKDPTKPKQKIGFQAIPQPLL